MRVRDFLNANNLKQVDIARYLGISEAAVSNVVKGKSEFSNENLIKILNNPHNWDVSMLTETEQPEGLVESKSDDRNTIDRLFALIDNQREEIKMLLDLLRMKDEKIDELRREIDARKEKTVHGVGSSSSVDVG